MEIDLRPKGPGAAGQSTLSSQKTQKRLGAMKPLLPREQPKLGASARGAAAGDAP
jgi:hypothetical protein